MFTDKQKNVLCVCLFICFNPCAGSVKCVYASEAKIILNTDVPEDGKYAEIEKGKWLIIDRTMPCSFMKHGERLVGANIGPLSSIGISFSNIYVVSGRELTEVSLLSQLRGHVEITSSAQALDFVRLGTYPLWYRGVRLSEEIAGVEVTKQSSAYQPNFGYPPHVDINTIEPGTNGIVPDDVFDALHLSQASCVSTDKGFLIHRRVMLDTYILNHSRVTYGKPVAFYDIVEYVGYDGTYKLRSKEYVSPPVYWRFTKTEGSLG